VDDNLFIIACKYGNLEVVKYLIKSEFTKIEKFEDCWGFKHAAEHGHLNLVKYFITIMPHSVLIYEWGKRYALNNGHIKTSEFLQQVINDLKNVERKIFCKANN
jgi:hypothetical protein